MKLSEIKAEELEVMSYDDLAYIILEEHGNKMKLLNIFKKIAKVLKMSDAEVEARIADFFELLSTDKRFVMLDKGYWDLSNKHMKNVIIEDEEDLDIDEEEIDIDDEIEDGEDNYDDGDESEEDSDVDNDLSDLVIIDPDEETSLD